MQNSIPTPDETRIELLELSFLAASGGAFSNAYDQAIRAGLSVMVSDNGAIYEVFPDGQRKFVKFIVPASTTRPGQKITFK